MHKITMGVGGGGQKGRVSRSPAFRAEELRSYFLCVAAQGLLCVGPPGLARPLRCPARTTAAPGERASARAMSLLAALRGDTGQALHDWDSARGGTGGFLEAGGEGGEGSLPLRGSLPQPWLPLESGPCAPSVCCLRDGSGSAVTVAENLSAPAQLPGPPLLVPLTPSRLPLVLDRFPGSDLAPVPS